MLIDLGRNDVGRVAQTGSVQRDRAHRDRALQHVMHIVSNVEGTAQARADAIDVLARRSPPAPVSGAPKVRAMEIIDELEPVRRGVYAGAVGYLGFHGDMDVAIAIRTGIIKDRPLYVQAGAGIVADSVPRAGMEGDRSTRRARCCARPSWSRRSPELIHASRSTTTDSFTFNLVQHVDSASVGADVRELNDEIAIAEVAAIKPDLLVICPARARPPKPASRWRRSAISPASCRSWACAWGTSVAARPSAARIGAAADARQDQRDHDHARSLRRQFAARTSPSTATTRWPSIARAAAALKVTRGRATARSWACATSRCRSRACSPPGSILTEHGHAMLKNFLELARETIDLRSDSVSMPPPACAPPWPCALGDDVFGTIRASTRCRIRSPRCWGSRRCSCPPAPRATCAACCRMPARRRVHGRPVQHCYRWEGGGACSAAAPQPLDPLDCACLRRHRSRWPTSRRPSSRTIRTSRTRAAGTGEHAGRQGAALRLPAGDRAGGLAKDWRPTSTARACSTPPWRRPRPPAATPASEAGASPACSTITTSSARGWGQPVIRGCGYKELIGAPPHPQDGAGRRGSRAAARRLALEHQVERLAQDHWRAAPEVAGRSRIAGEPPQTNILRPDRCESRRQAQRGRVAGTPRRARARHRRCTACASSRTSTSTRRASSAPSGHPNPSGVKSCADAQTSFCHRAGALLLNSRRGRTCYIVTPMPAIRSTVSRRVDDRQLRRFTFNLVQYLGAGREVAVLRQRRRSPSTRSSARPDASCFARPRTPNEAGVRSDVIRASAAHPDARRVLGHQAMARRTAAVIRAKP